MKNKRIWSDEFINTNTVHLHMYVQKESSFHHHLQMWSLVWGQNL